MTREHKKTEETPVLLRIDFFGGIIDYNIEDPWDDQVLSFDHDPPSYKREAMEFIVAVLYSHPTGFIDIRIAGEPDTHPSAIYNIIKFIQFWILVALYRTDNEDLNWMQLCLRHMGRIRFLPARDRMNRSNSGSPRIRVLKDLVHYRKKYKGLRFIPYYKPWRSC